MRRPLLVRRAWLICAVLSAVPRSARFRRIASKRWEKTTAVAVKIKLKRLGKIREPYYRIVVADARTKRDGRAAHRPGPRPAQDHRGLAEVHRGAGGRGHSAHGQAARGQEGALHGRGQ